MEIIVCTNVNRCLLFAFSSNGPLGTRDVALPSSRSFGQRYAPSSGDVGCLPIGLSLSKLATSYSTVCYSENVTIPSPMEALIARFTDLIRAPVIPFCQGASADVKIHSNPSVTPKLLVCSNPNSW